MSHFTVAVFSDGRKTVEELLAPYQENNMGDCPKEYLEFVSATEREREEYETGGVKRVCLQDGKYMYPWDEDGLKDMFSHTIFNDGRDHSNFYKDKKEYLIRNTTDPILGNVQIVFHLEEKGAELRTVPHKEIYQTLQDYVKDYVEAPWDEEKQDYGYWENPNAKWDWWQIGGRWKGFLKASGGEKGEISLVYPIEDERGKYAQARVGDIDFEPDQENYNKKLRWWEVVVENSPLRPGESEKDFFSAYKKEFYINRYKTKETYAKIQSSVVTHAVIMPDGKWYQKGDMGWFGLSSETEEESYDWDMHFKENFIDKADPDWILTIVDCHI